MLRRNAGFLLVMLFPSGLMSVLLLLWWLGAFESETSRWARIEACLPDGVNLSTPLSYRSQAPTVQDRLAELGAYSEGGKLYDLSGREIAFFDDHPGPTWNKPLFMKRSEELFNKRRQMEKRYRVIVIEKHGPMVKAHPRTPSSLG